MGSPVKTDRPAVKQPNFTWASDGVSSCRSNMSQRSLPNYPPALATDADRFEAIRVQYCRNDDRSPRMAFLFLQDGPKILFSDSEETVRFKADLILAAARIASSSSEFAVSVRQYADPAAAALRTLDLHQP